MWCQEAQTFSILADMSAGDWLGGFLYSAGQQANEAVQDQLSAPSISRFSILAALISFLRESL